MRALVGKTESITEEEASLLYDKQKTEFLYYMVSIVDESTDDEEERASLKMNLTNKLGNLLGTHELLCLLRGESVYLASLPYSEGVKFEDIS